MTLTPAWRTRLFASVAAFLAIVLGVQIAHGALLLPALVAGLLLGLVILVIQPRPLLSLLLAGAVLGYIIGNRGFAQLSLLASFPLLPGEIVLLTGGLILAFQSAWHRELPVRRDLLNAGLLLWMGVGTVRLLFDVRTEGFAALRDYALVYYAGFFFLAQHAARAPASARFLLRSVLAGCLVLLVVHPLFGRFTDVFVNTLTVRGIPLIFYKDDLVGNFLAVGAVLAFVRHERSGNRLWWVASLALTGLMLTTGSRSSMVALGVGALWLCIGGRWRFLATLSVTGLLLALTLAFVAHLQNESWRQTPLHRLYDRIVSIADPMGQRSYQSEEIFKGDNNVFRLVWWRAAIDETVESNPWFGLGFGHDLAGRFVRQYFPEGNDEFNARSPHNVLITVFARMGLVGFGAFLLFLAAFTRNTWRSLRPRHAGEVLTTSPPWLGAWVILVAACFGVVLEGPMGAVVFWTLLGVANGGGLAGLEQDVSAPATSVAGPALPRTTPSTGDDLMLAAGPGDASRRQ